MHPKTDGSRNGISRYNRVAICAIHQLALHTILCHRLPVSVRCAVILWVIQVLVELEVCSDMSVLHVVVEVLVLLLGMNAGFWG